MNNPQLVKLGIRNALGVIVYVAGVALLLNNAQALFGTQGPDGPLAPLMMLLLFIVSALTTGSLVLWQPLKLLADGKKNEAGMLLLVTGGTLVVFLVLVAVTLISLK